MDFRSGELYSLCIPLYSSFHFSSCWPPGFSTPASFTSPREASLTFIVHLDSPYWNHTYACNLSLSLSLIESVFSECLEHVMISDTRIETLSTI